MRRQQTASGLMRVEGDMWTRREVPKTLHQRFPIPQSTSEPEKGPGDKTGSEGQLQEPASKDSTHQ